MYNEVMKLMSLVTARRRCRPGGLFHWVAETDDGLRVVDVWESKEQFEQFAQDADRAYIAQVGIPTADDALHRRPQHAQGVGALRLATG
jgi:hypothetical protein